MNKYLEKIAELDKKQKTHMAQGMAGAFTAAVAGDVVGGAVNKHGILVHKDPHGFMNDHQYEAMKKHVSEHTNSTFSYEEAGLPKGSLDPHGPLYMHKDHFNQAQGPFGAKMKKNFISMPEEGHNGLGRQKMVGVHEMGHAMDYQHRKPGSGGIRASRALGRGPVAGMVAAGMLANDKTRDYAPIVPLIGHAPELYSEAKANIHGHRLVKQFGGNTSQFRRFAVKQLAGYAAKPLVGAAVLAGAAHLIKKRNEPKK